MPKQEVFIITPDRNEFVAIANMLKGYDKDHSDLWGWNRGRLEYVIRNHDISIILIDLDRVINVMNVVRMIRVVLPSTPIICYMQEWDEEAASWFRGRDDITFLLRDSVPKEISTRIFAE